MTIQPFNGLERFKQRCASYDAPQDPTPASDVVPIVTIVPRSGLFDIYKRTTDQSINRCVGIGFTYADALHFIKQRLKTTADVYMKVVTYYDIVPQDNVLAKDPLWNPKEITKDGGTFTDYSDGKQNEPEWKG